MKRSRIIKMILIVLSLILLLCLAASASDDFQYWSRITLKTWERAPFSLSTYGDLRFMENSGDLRLYLISEQWKYRKCENLDLGLAITYLNSKTRLPSGEDTFQHQQRLELEVNPHWKTPEGLKIKNRNRVEFRRIEDRGSDNTRFRHSWECEISWKEGFPVQSFYLGNEFFYDFEKNAWNENWLTPAGFKIRLCDKSVLQVFYMIQSKKGDRDWSSNQVLGTHYIFSF